MKRNINIKTYEDNTLLFTKDTTCLQENNFISYYTDNDLIKINLDDFSFIKDNNESILNINNNSCTLFIKDLNQSLDLPLDELEYTNDQQKITIRYKLASQELPFKIILEIGDVINEI